jgi:DNA-binding transcriptional ArsR family regulator
MLSTREVADAVAALDEAATVAALAALAHPARLRVFRALVGAGPAGMTPGDVATLLGLPASTLSGHLKELARAGLIAPQRDGRHLIYRPAIETMNALLAYLTAHCCQGQDCGLGSVAVSAAAPPRRSSRCDESR